MQRAWLIGVVAVSLCGQTRGDEPARKFQVVTPKADGINATGINGQGDVTGFEWVDSQKFPGVVDQVPFFARGKAITHLPLLAGYTATFPAAVSDEGDVVGRSSKPAPPRVVVPMRNQAFVWDARNGIRGLGALEGDTASFASDITPDGKRISGFSVGNNRVRACLWDREGAGWKAVVLPSTAILGSNVVALSDSGKLAAAVDGERPCLWTEKGPGRWIQEMIGPPGSLVPRAVNNSGLVAGLRFTFDGMTHAVIWSREKGLTQLEKPAGYVRSEALSVNNEGVVVGMVDGPGGSHIGPNAFVYENGRFRLFERSRPRFRLRDRDQRPGTDHRGLREDGRG